ncbi:unnamed protein product, partial [Symbiodinium sp. KB8]
GLLRWVFASASCLMLVSWQPSSQPDAQRLRPPVALGSTPPSSFLLRSAELRTPCVAS